MRICIISPRYPSEWSTESVFVEQLVNQWALQGHQCTVIAPFPVTTFLRGKVAKARYFEHRLIANNTYVNIYNPWYIALRGVNIGKVSLSSYWAKKAIERTINRHHIQFDIVYCHFFVQGIRVFKYVEAHNKPLFVATGESTIPNLGKPYSTFEWKGFRNYLSGCICVSTKNMNEACELGYVEKKECIVVPNGIDESIFHKKDKSACRELLGFDKNDFIICCVGAFCERKGQDRIIKAVEQLASEHIKLVFVGAGDMTLDNNHIVYKGPVEHNRIPDFLNASDIFVLPTLREGCCNAIIEAMACGLPIVSSDLPFNHDILSEQNSILVNPESVAEIADGIKKLFKDNEFRTRLGEMSLKTASNLSIRQRASRIMDFINSKINANS